MACNIQRNQSGDIISATTNTGEESVLFNQLDNLSDSKEVAATLYAVTETAEFKKWFGDSTYLNNVGEPALRGEFYTNSEGETWWAKSTNIQDAKTKFPFGLNRVAGLTARQVNDIANFTYAFLLRKTDSVEATEKIDLKDVKKIIAGLKNSYTKIGDVETLKVLSILEEDLLDKKTGLYNTESKFLEILKNRLKADGLIEDKVSEKDRTNPLNIKERYFTSPKDSASVSLKLMIKSLMDTSKRDATLRQPMPASFTGTFNLLLRELSGVVPYKNANGVIDVYDVYIDKLNELAVDFPYLSQLTAKLNNAPEYVKTRFVNGLALEKINYTQTLYEGGIGTKEFRVGMPSAQQGFEIIRSEWTEDFKAKMFTFNKNANIILNEDYALQAKDKYKALVQNARDRSDATLAQVQKEFKKLLDYVGVTVSDKTIAKNYNSKKAIYDFLGATETGIGFIFTKEIPGIVNRYKERTKQRKDIIRLSDTDLPIKNEKSVLTLAKQEEEFRLEYTDNSTLGPQGDMYWGFGNYSWMAQALDTIQKEDSGYLEALAKVPYNVNSKWINQLLQGAKIDRSVFMQMKQKDNYEGRKYFDLQDPDQLADRIARVMSGEHILMTPGNSRTLYTLSGFDYENSGVNITFDGKNYNFEYTVDENGNNNVIETFRGYIEDEFASMETAYRQVFEEKIAKEDQILFYHYDKNGKERDSQGRPAGNAFKHVLFPELSFGNEAAKDFYTNKGKPVYNSKMIGENEAVTNLIKAQFEKYAVSQIEQATEYKLIEKNLANRELPINILGTARFKNLGSLAIGRVMSDYVFSNIVANVESTKLFVGDIKFYKNIEDFVKRANLYTTSVVPMRFIKGEVNPTYLQATVNDIFAPSKYLQSVEGYDNVDLSDATTWISPELQKQRMKGFGEWTPEVEAAYDRMMKGEVQASDILKLTPRKSASRGTELKNGMNVPYREKTAEVVLWPGLVNNAGLKTLYDQMLEEEQIYKERTGADVGMSVSVESAIKVGAGLRTKIDNNEGEILDEFVLNPIEKSHLLYGKQQEIPTKGIKPVTLGSQLKINILADIDDKTIVGGRPASEWKKELEILEGKMSDLGKSEFLSKYGISEDLDINEEEFRKALIDVLSKQSFPDKTLIEGLESGLEFDAIFQSRRKILNTLANELTKATVTYNATGANMVQISSFGLFQKPTALEGLDEATRSRIRYLKDGNLKPPRLVNGKLEIGDIFIPYSYIEQIPGHENMSDQELKQRIGKDVLTVVGYRIPNQSLASTDVLNIAGILPKEAGDTVVVYEEMTAKTGSDFDIDKLFMLMPNASYNKDTGTLELVDPEGDSRQSLENKRIQLYKQLFETAEQYPRIIKSIDTQKLKDDAYKLIELAGEQDQFDGLKLFTGEFQQQLKTRFSAGAAGVGATANNTIDNVMGQGAKLNMPYIGMGKSSIIGDTRRTILYSTDRIDGDLISEIMSGYMNAFVDIEKDPYITKINFVKSTMNVGFLMLRAGIDPKFINAFIKQPVIVEYAKQSALGRSRLLNPYRFASESSVLENLGASPSLPTENLTLDNLLKAIDPSQEVEPGFRQEVLNYFAFLHEYGDKLYQQNLASKVHTEGVGQDLLDATLKLDIIDSINDDKDQVVGNFDSKFNEDTMLGKYLENGPELFTNLFFDKFLSGNFDALNGQIENLLGDYYKHNYRSRRQIEDAMYSYMYSDHLFESSIEDLLFDTNSKKSLVGEFLDMQKKLPDSILLNTILKYKYTRNAEGQYSMPSQLYIANTKHMPPDTIDLAKQEWEDMLNSKDENVKQFANKLAAYAYHTSGFRRGVQTFHQLIPTLWNVESEFNDTVQYMKSENTAMINMGLEQIVQHEYTNSALAPKTRKVIKIDGIDESEGFFRKPKQNDPYVTRVSNNKLGLYRLEGTVSTPKGNRNLYKRINTLGFKGEDGFRVVEYKFGVSDVNSIFVDNQVTTSPAMQQLVQSRLLIERGYPEMKYDNASEINKCK